MKRCLCVSLTALWFLVASSLSAQEANPRPAADTPTFPDRTSPESPAAPDRDSPHHDKLAKELEPPTLGMAVLVPTEGNEVYGIVCLKEEGDTLHLKGKVKGLTPGLHGFHIHKFGDLSDRTGKSAGDHFDPHGKQHGSLDSPERHLGDLGNIEADEDGLAHIDIQVKGLPLHFVLGRSLVVHADEDDLMSQPAGDSGDRVALGVIGIADPKAAESFMTSHQEEASKRPQKNADDSKSNDRGNKTDLNRTDSPATAPGANTPREPQNR